MESPEMLRSVRMFQRESAPSWLRVKWVALMETVECCSMNLAARGMDGIVVEELSVPQDAGSGAEVSASVAVRSISKTWRSRGAADMMPCHLPFSSPL